MPTRGQLPTAGVSAAPAAGKAGQTPEEPRRWLSTRWVSTMPMASISANMVVGPTKAKPLFPQGLGQRHGFRRLRRHVGVAGRLGCGGGLELPDKVNQAALAPGGDGGPGIGDGGADLEPVAHDAGILKQAFDVRLGKGGNCVRVEVVEGGPEGRTLAQDGGPRQAGLEGLQADAFVKALLVPDGEAPLGVVVLAQERIC